MTYFARNGINYNVYEASKKTGLKCEDPSLADQSQKEDVDIQTIVKNFNLTGQLPVGGLNLPKYGDFTGIFDFQSAQNAIRAAQESFMDLPWDLRARFNNDPQTLLEFVEDPNNKEEGERLGLFKKTPPEQEKPVVSLGTDISSTESVPTKTPKQEKGKEKQGDG